jgi:DNA polymerase-1
LSPDQIKEYANSRNHTLTNSGKRLDSSEERYLAVMHNRYHDRLYSGTIEYRGINKLLGTYTNWPMESIGNGLAKVHTRYTLTPATGRLASTAPNTQNIVNDEDDPLAMEFRKIIVPSPGNILIRADYRGIEAVLTGYFAGDEAYMSLALKGVHAYNVANYLKLQVPALNDPALVPFLKGVKKQYPALYGKIKKVGHGINYGEGPFKIYDQNPGMFENRAEAKQLWKFIRSQMPKVIEWQNRTVLQAGTTRRLQNPFGRPRWFFDIPGEDGPAAIAQQPQSTAADVIFEAMIACDEDPGTPECPGIGEWLVWQIHDELVLDAPVEYAIEAAKRLKAIMERPIPELGGLVIEADVKLGYSLGQGLSLEEFIAKQQAGPRAEQTMVAAQ